MHLTKEDTVAAHQMYILYPLQDPAMRPLKTTVKVEDQDLIMEVYIGASVTVINEAMLGWIWQTTCPATPSD